MIPWKALISHLVNQSAEVEPGAKTNPAFGASGTNSSLVEENVSGVTRGRSKRATGWAKNWAIMNADNSRSTTTGSLAKVQYRLYEECEYQLASKFAPASTKLLDAVKELRQKPALIEKLIDLGANETSVLEGLWDVTEIPLLANVKGCGYPPLLNCSNFHLLTRDIGTLFPCYANHMNQKHRRNSTMAIFQHDPQLDNIIILIGFIVPLAIFTASLLVLCCWHNKLCIIDRCARRFRSKSANLDESGGLTPCQTTASCPDK